MTIEYENTLEDLIAFNMYHMEHSPSQKRRRIFYKIGFPLVWFILLQPTSQENLVSALMIVVPLTLVWVFLIPRFVRFSTKRQIRKLYKEGKNKGNLGKHKIHMTSEYLIEESETGEFKTKWSGVEKIERNDDYLFIYVGSIAAHIIPRREIATQTEYDNIYQQFLKYQQRNAV